MRLRSSSVLPLLFLLPALGCTDPADPCDQPNACEADGIDLAVVEVALVTDGVHPATGLGLVPSDTVEITYSVRNRGSEHSEASRMVVDYGDLAGGHGLLTPDTQAVPALRPGELHQGRVRLESWEAIYGARAAGSDTARASVRVLLPDADTSNNVVESARVHRRIALTRLDVEVPDTVVSLTVPFTVQIRTTNESAVAAMPAGALGFMVLLCESATAYYCSAVLDTRGFGVRPWPALAPGETHAEELALSVPLYGADNIRPARYRLVTMLGPSDLHESTLYGLHWLFNDDVSLSVHPNFEACDPVRLRPDTTVAAPLVCSIPNRTYVFELHARSDHEYSFEQGAAPGATVKRADGSKVMDVLPGTWYRFTEPGPLYVVDYLPVSEPTTPTRSMTLRERPLTSPVVAATGALR